jgi:hypothetical protein
MKPVGLTQRQRDQVARRRHHGMLMLRTLPILAAIILASLIAVRSASDEASCDET